MPIPTKKTPQNRHFWYQNTIFSPFRSYSTFLVHSYPIFGESLTLFRAETPFLALAGENSLGQSGGPSGIATSNFANFLDKKNSVKGGHPFGSKILQNSI